MMSPKLFNKQFVPCATPLDSWYELPPSSEQERNKTIHLNIMKNCTYPNPKKDERKDHICVRSSKDATDYRLCGLKAIDLRNRELADSEEGYQYYRSLPLHETYSCELEDKKWEWEGYNYTIPKTTLKKKLQTPKYEKPVDKISHLALKLERYQYPTKKSDKAKREHSLRKSTLQHEERVVPSKHISRKEQFQSNATNQPRTIPADSKGLYRTSISHNAANNLMKNSSEIIDLLHKSEKRNVMIEGEPKCKEYVWNDYFLTKKKFITTKNIQQGYNKKVMDLKTFVNDTDVNLSSPKKFSPPPIRINAKWTEKIPYIYYSPNNPKKKREHKSTETNSHFEKKEMKPPMDLKTQSPSVQRVSKEFYNEINKEKQIYRVVMGNEKINLNKIVTDLLKKNENNVIVITKTDTVATVPTVVTNQQVSKTSSVDYIKFAEDITTDVIKNNMYSDHSMKQVFKKHFEMNRNKLDEDKMSLEIHALKTALNIADSNGSIKSNSRNRKLMPRLSESNEKNAASNEYCAKSINGKSGRKPINLIESTKSFLSKGYGYDTTMKDKLTKNAWLGYKDIKLDETINLFTKQHSVIKALMNIDVTNAIKFQAGSNYPLMDKGDPEKEYDTRNDVTVDLQPEEQPSRFYEVPFNCRDDETINE